MAVHRYFADLSRELQHQSARVREAFKTHRPSAGDNRESMVAKLIERHIPEAFGVDTGWVISREGAVSKQADIVIFDRLLNTPLHSDLPEKVWLCESVYALIEVKTKLTPSDLEDCVKKCRCFKKMERRFLDGPFSPAIKESLFVIWAFEAAKPWIVKENMLKAIADVPISERPDFLVVPESLIAIAGSYFELSKLGQPNSPWRRQLGLAGDAYFDQVMSTGLEVSCLEESTMFTYGSHPGCCTQAAEQPHSSRTCLWI